MFILSKHGNSKQVQNSVPWVNRMLPLLGANTVAILTMLARWSFASTDRGGLKDDTPRSAAADVLSAMLSEACAGCSDAEVCIEVNPAWRCMWPRPSCTPSAPRMMLRLTDEGNVCLKEFQLLPGVLGVSRPARAWHKAFFGPLPAMAP